jgi:hypothetical protein
MAMRIIILNRQATQGLGGLPLSQITDFLRFQPFWSLKDFRSE